MTDRPAVAAPLGISIATAGSNGARSGSECAQAFADELQQTERMIIAKDRNAGSWKPPEGKPWPSPVESQAIDH